MKWPTRAKTLGSLTNFMRDPVLLESARRALGASVEGIPERPGLPILGSQLDIRGRQIEFFVETAQRYGDLVALRFGSYRFFFANHPDAYRRILQEAPWNYTKSFGYRLLQLVIGNGLLMSEGEFWRKQRKLIQPAFHHKRLTAFAQTMTELGDDLVAEWSRRPAKTVDIHREMSELTLRIIGKTMFSVDPHGPEASRFSDAVTVALESIGDYATGTINPPLWVPTWRNLQFKKARHTLYTYIERIIHDRQNTGARHEDLLDMLMHSTDDDSQRMSDRQLRDEVLTMFAAGHETTAAAMTWLWLLVSQHPDVEAKLHTELDEVLGDRLPTLEDVSKLVYTEQIINETLRYYPPAWTFTRQAIDDDVLCGKRIPAGSVLILSPYCLHRNTAFWENPDRFDPERFAPGAGDDRHRFAYLPFGGGPRICVGNAFAMMEMKLLVAIIAKKFRLRPDDPTSVKPRPAVTLRPAGGLPGRLLPRS